MLDALLVGLAVNAVTESVRGTARAMSAKDHGQGGVRHFGLDTLDVSSLYARSGSLPLMDDLDPRQTAVLARVLEDPRLGAVTHMHLVSQMMDQPEVETQRLLEGYSILLPVADRDLAGRLYDAFDALVLVLMSELDAADPGARDAMRQHAGQSAMLATLRNIEGTLATLGGAVNDEEAFNEATRRYRRQVVARHGKITLSYHDEERRFDIDDMYIEARLRGKIDDAETEVEGGLTQLTEEHSRVVITGNPGGGKSTLSQVLATRFGKGDGLLPVLIVLREYGSDFEQNVSLLAHAELKFSARYQLDQPSGWLKAMLSLGRCIVIFDGLDELLFPARRRKIRDAIEAFADEYPLCRIVVTSRNVGYEQAPLSVASFSRMYLCEFDEEAVEQYAEAYFKTLDLPLTAAELSLRVDQFVHESSSVVDLRSNPLLLSLMCVLYQGQNYIPESRLALYEECAKLLFRRWDKSREIDPSLEINANDIDGVFMDLALWMLTSDYDQSGVLEEALVERCVDYLVPRRYEEREDGLRVAEEFIGFCRGRAWILADAGATAGGRRLYAFTHRTFLEYYAAHQLIRTYGGAANVAQAVGGHLAEGSWDVVALLAVQLLAKQSPEGCEDFIAGLLGIAEKPTMSSYGRAQLLTFASRVLADQPTSPRISRALTSEVVSFTLEAERLEASRRGDFDDWGIPTVDGAVMLAELTNSPYATLLRVNPANYPAVAAQLAEDLLFAATRRPLRSPQSRAVAFAMGTLTSVASSMAASIGDSDVRTSRWREWTRITISSGLRWDDEYAGYPLAVTGGIESGEVSLRRYAGLGRLFHLFEMPGSDALGIGRLATMPLLNGWLLGSLHNDVIEEERARSLLVDMATVALERSAPEITPRGFFYWGDYSRHVPPTLPFRDVPGAPPLGLVALSCMSAELSGEDLDVWEWPRPEGSGIAVGQRIAEILIARRFGREHFDASQLPSLYRLAGASLSFVERFEAWSVGTFSFWREAAE